MSNLRLPSQLGVRIKRLRTEQGHSQKWVAEQAEITSAYLSELEHGKKDSPSPEVLSRIAAVLGVGVGYLEGRDVLAEFSRLQEEYGAELPNLLEQLSIKPLQLLELFEWDVDRLLTIFQTFRALRGGVGLKRDDFLREWLRVRLSHDPLIFKQLEEEGVRVRQGLGLAAGTLTTERLEGSLLSALRAGGIRVRREDLGNGPGHAPLDSLRVLDGALLLIDQGVGPGLYRFLIARELACQHLRLKDRSDAYPPPPGRGLGRLESDYRAWHLALTTLMPAKTYLEQLGLLIQQTDLAGATAVVEGMLAHPLTPATDLLMARMTQLLRTAYDMEPFFIQLEMRGGGERVGARDEFHIVSRLTPDKTHVSHFNRNEHHCRRWLTIDLVKRLSGTEARERMIGFQKSLFTLRNSYLFSLTVAQKGAGFPYAVTLALPYQQIHEIAPFVVHAPFKEVGETCETCELYVGCDEAVKGVYRDDEKARQIEREARVARLQKRASVNPREKAERR